jgi:hypothetical protein
MDDKFILEKIKNIKINQYGLPRFQDIADLPHIPTRRHTNDPAIHLPDPQ